MRIFARRCSARNNTPSMRTFVTEAHFAELSEERCFANLKGKKLGKQNEAL